MATLCGWFATAISLRFDFNIVIPLMRVCIGWTVVCFFANIHAHERITRREDLRGRVVAIIGIGLCLLLVIWSYFLLSDALDAREAMLNPDS